MKVTILPIEEIKVGNRYRIDKGDIDGLAESIREKGLIQPITVDEKHNLLAGERRLLACKQAGLTEIPTIVRASNKQDGLEIELLENIARKDMTWAERARLEKAIWELKKSQDKDWSQTKQASMSDQSQPLVNRRIQLADALEILPDLAECQTEDEAWKQYKRLEENYVADVLVSKASPEIKQAAKWAENHYILGDALEQMAECSHSIAHFAEVDPPYAVQLNKRKSRNKSKMNLGEYNEIDEDEYETFLTNVATEVYRILKDHAFAVFWYGMSQHDVTLRVLRRVGFGVPDIPAIWDKGDVGQTARPDTTLGSCYEPFFLARKGQPKLAKPGRGNVFRFKTVSSSKKIHATEKPIELLTEILGMCLFPGSAIISPFLGSGVTLRAAYKLGHTGWGYDLSEEHKKSFLRKVGMEMLEGADVETV